MRQVQAEVTPELPYRTCKQQVDVLDDVDVTGVLLFLLLLLVDRILPVVLVLPLLLQMVTLSLLDAELPQPL
jgi:hypothetical protein